MVYIDEDSSSSNLAEELNKCVAEFGLSFELQDSEEIYGVDLLGLLNGRKVRVEVRGLLGIPGHSKQILVFDGLSHELLGSGDAAGDLKSAFMKYKWNDITGMDL